ncbi:hypothetical protein [Sphaerisporangium dianthi]|uniref:Uncharacterized protein n=1 Tax=Sphaerisporangium dianthi TaxID=1436120 RepID=A0ABV9CUI3_9ACTN
MSGSEVAVAVILGLLINECCDIAPWLARMLVKRSAHLRYNDRSRAETRAEELTAFINDRPGKLLKLATALAFIFISLVAYGVQAIRRWTSSAVDRLGTEDQAFASLQRWTIGHHGTTRSYRDPRFDRVIVCVTCKGNGRGDEDWPCRTCQGNGTLKFLEPPEAS